MKILKRNETELRKRLEKEIIENKDMKIVNEGNQYGIRIPKNFVHTIEQSIGKIKDMKFKFTLKIPEQKSNEKPKLTGELIYGR